MAAALSIGGKPPDQKAVLLVEDEVLLRADLADELRDAGYKVIEAPSADAARDVLESAIEVDLVCTDVRMPGRLNGIQLAQWIKDNRPGLPVIVVSGEITARHVPNVADAMFTKPVDYDRLLHRIAELLVSFRANSGPSS